MTTTTDVAAVARIRVLVCGGRDYADKRAVYYVLDRIEAENRIDAILNGGATGADHLARDWAHDDVHHPTVLCRTWRADWRKHGRAAGPIRNQRMLDDGRPDLVVAFSGGAGTADMVRRARRAKVRVLDMSLVRQHIVEEGSQ